MANVTLSQTGVSDLTEIRPAMPGKGVMARKTSPPERMGSSEPAATMVPAAKMRVASATEMAMSTVTTTVAAAVTSSVSAAAFADRRAG